MSSWIRFFTDIERAARIRLETEATSKLEYLATSNQANQVQIQKEQAYRDYLSALQRLNLWFANDTLFTVPDIPATQLDEPLNYVADSLMNHPILNVSKQRVDVADATIKERRSQFFPQLQGQYGRQQVDGQSGFYQYQIGIRIPLFFGPELGRTQSAKNTAGYCRTKPATKPVGVECNLSGNERAVSEMALFMELLQG